MKRLALYFAIASAVGTLFLYLAIRELDIASVQAFIRDSDTYAILGHTLVFCTLYSICHGARLVRWSYLVRPIDREISLGQICRIGAVGFMAILVLPLRLGELVRPYLLSRESSVPMSAALGTAVVERILDGLIVTGLLFLTLQFYAPSLEADTARWARLLGLTSAAIFVPALLVCGLTLWRRDWTVRSVRALGVVLKIEVITEKIASLLESFLEGFLALKSSSALGWFLLASAIYWGTNVCSMWYLARFGFGLDVMPGEMAAVLAILVIGIMIPAGPGMAGNFEFFLVKGLGFFVVVSTPEISGRVGAFAGWLHILQFVVILLPGMLAMAVDPRSRGLLRLVSEAENAMPGRSEG